MTRLVLGPLLRYAGATEATVWVETDGPCEVTVLAGGTSHHARTFRVEGHHYALAHVTSLAPGSAYPYRIVLNGEPAWPQENSGFPPSLIRTIAPDGRLRLVYGSCRVSAPHDPPYTQRRGFIKRGGLRGQRFERDALCALAMEMRREPPERWPDALTLLGDQIYADEPSPGTETFIRSRRNPDDPPGVADFEEYTHLYRDSWSEPAIRWLLSTIPSTMIFDDHDVHDDWNTSEAWVRKMRSKPWWSERVIGGFVSYWIYQHLGNLSPLELEEDDLFRCVRGAEDATLPLREFARAADRDPQSYRWSFYRDFGGVRLIVADSRAGRVLDEDRRSMLDEEEWSWIEGKISGEFDHLLFGTSLPFLLPPGLHHLEAWNEKVCRGAWGRSAARIGETLRQGLDLEHWSAFHDSFLRLAKLLRSIACGERSSGPPPASVIVLSGDVHHGYLAEAAFEGVTASPVYQAVGSPLRNPL
ncbi:MAG: alkaline phosphatase D family protein, partial [Actinomycetota bacterium]